MPASATMARVVAAARPSRAMTVRAARARAARRSAAGIRVMSGTTVPDGRPGSQERAGCRFRWRLALCGVPPVERPRRLEGQPRRRLAHRHILLEPDAAGVAVLLGPGAVVVARGADHL